MQDNTCVIEMSARRKLVVTNPSAAADTETTLDCRNVG